MSSAPDESDPAVRNFDLNADVNDTEDTKAAATAAQAAATAAQASATAAQSSATASQAAPAASQAAPAASQVAPTAAQASSAGPISEPKHEEYPGWSLADVDRMAIDPLQLANLSRRLDEDEEDYDEEG